MTLHDYHPPHDKVNATNNVPQNRQFTLHETYGVQSVEITGYH